MPTLTEYVTVYRWPDEPADEPDKVRSDEHSHDCSPDEFDREDGLTAVDLAVRVMQDAGVIEASSWPNYGGPHTWYSAETYQHPYSGEFEERTFHPSGFTESELRAIFDRITA